MPKADEQVEGYIATVTGEIVNPLTPDPDTIHIGDIAHALSNICRFTGHTREFYSVAQHSYLMSGLVSPENQLTALLHDASEAYLADLARPIKQAEGFGEYYKRVEDNLMESIVEAFDGKIIWPLPTEIKEWDTKLLRAEQKQLMPDVLIVDAEDIDLKIDPLNPVAARTLFLDRWWELSGETRTWII